MALGQLTVRSMWNQKLVDIFKKATQYDESVRILDNKMNVNAAKEPIVFSILGFLLLVPSKEKKEQHPFLKTFLLYTALKSERILRGIGLHYLITD